MGCLKRIIKSEGWLRGQDSNLRPSGYEPDELPGCSTPRQFYKALILGLYPESKKSRHRLQKNLCHCEEDCLESLNYALGRPGNDLLSHTLRCSTIGAEGLHGRVRNGIGCCPLAIATGSTQCITEGRSWPRRDGLRQFYKKRLRNLL